MRYESLLEDPGLPTGSTFSAGVKNHHRSSSDLCAAGYVLDVNPWPVTLAPDIYTTMNVRLQMPPADGNVVTVIVDSSAGADFFLVSTCKLTFTSADWNVYQPVYIIPVFASSIAITSPVCLHFRPHVDDHHATFSTTFICITCYGFPRGLQTANIVLTAQGYSAVYNGDYLSTLFSSTGGGSSALSSAFNDAVVPTNVQPVRKEVPVTLARAAVSSCTTWGDPHVTTYDGWGYHPQVQGLSTFSLLCLFLVDVSL